MLAFNSLSAKEEAGFMKKIQLIDIAILAVFSSFLVAYLGISYFNRVMQDDFFFYDRIKTFGITTSVADYYFHFEGAFASFFWVHLIAFINQYSTTIFFVNLFNITVIFTSLFLLLTQILQKILPYYSIRIPFNLCVLIITSVLYFQNDVIQQSVFWFTGSTVYMATVSWLLLGIYFLMKKGNMNFIFSSLFLFLFAGTRLHYALIELGILFYFLLWYFLEDKKINNRFIVVLIIAMAGFSIYLFAPGNYSGRFSSDEQNKLLTTPLTFYIKQITGSLVYYFYVHILKILPLLLLNFILAFILGLTDVKNSFSKTVYLSFAIFSLYAIAISWLSLAVVMSLVQNGAGPSRTFFLPLFITVMLININLYFLGIRLKNKVQTFAYLTIPVGMIACGYFIFFLFSDLENLEKFSTQFDQRIEAIDRAKKSLTAKDTLYLTILPDTKAFMNNESKGDVWIEWVKCQQLALKTFYKTPFQIKLIPDNNRK